MPQPLHAIGDVHVALEQIVLVTRVRIDPVTGEAAFIMRIQGSPDPIRAAFPDVESAKAEHAALIREVGEARLLGRPPAMQTKPK